MIQAAVILCTAVSVVSALDVSLSSTTTISSPSEWNSTEKVQFSTGKTKPYECGDYCIDYFKNGLQFTGGHSYDLRNRLEGSNDGLIIGAQGAGTIVQFNGSLQGTLNNAFIDIYLKDGGKFIVGGDAEMDLVPNGSLYTRQIWIASESGGVFEVEEGYKAERDCTDASGSYRFHNTTFISHHSQSLPFNTMKSCMDCPDGFDGVNGHLVFESQAGSRWIVASNDQTYPAALWIWVDVTIEARKNITHTGRYVVLESPYSGGTPYKLAGAFQTLENNVTITKEGPADLILEGGQAYKSGAHMDIRAGGVVFKSNAVGGVFRSSDQATGGADLAVSVADNARVAFLYDGVQLESLSLANDATLEVALGGASDFDFDANGTLLISNALGRSAEAGETFTIFKTLPGGQFNNVETPDEGSWDLSKLYSEGKVTLSSGSVGLSRADFSISRGSAGAYSRDSRLQLIGQIRPGATVRVHDAAGRAVGRIRAARDGLVEIQTHNLGAQQRWAAPVE